MCDLLDKPDELKAFFDRHAGEDKLLSRCELSGMVKEKLGENCKEAKDAVKMQEMFNCWDKDGDGKLDFDEFKSALEMMKKVKEGIPCDMLK